MSTTAAPAPFAFAGFPLASWAFASRIWIAVVIALYAGFWLQLDAAFSAAITVAIVALPTRGQALEKAAFRLVGTIIGVVASIVIVGCFAQERDLLLAAFAVWIGLCVYGVGLWDGNRAYAAALSGYTVGLVAMQQIDAPLQVFDTGVERGAAIAVGIVALAFVNDLLAAPDRHPGLAAQLAGLHRRVRAYKAAAVSDDAVAAAGLLHEIAALRPEIASLTTESSSGSARSAAAGSAAVALVAQLQAARVASLLPDTAGATNAAGAAGAWASAELQRRDRDVADALAALDAGTLPPRAWRPAFYRCHRLAAEAGLRAALWMVLPSVFLIVTGWPSTGLSLALVTVIIGLGATTPNPRAFTVMALVATPIAAAVAGLLEFVVLDGADQFPLLAIALAPVAIGGGLLITWPHPLVASLGRLALIFTLAIFAPTNPQNYDPQTYLFASLFVCLSVGLMLASQLLLPPISDERRRAGLLAAARRDLQRPARSGRAAPEEAMFRDAVRIGQIAATGATTGAVDPQQRAVLHEALVLFDQTAMLRLCDARLCDAPRYTMANSPVVVQARKALLARDVPAIRRAAAALRGVATKATGKEDEAARKVAAMLDAASFVLGEKRP